MCTQKQVRLDADVPTADQMAKRIADLEATIARLLGPAQRLVSRVDMPDHVTAKHYSTSDTKRVPARALATLRNAVREVMAKGEAKE